MDSFKLYNNERGLARLLCNWRNFYRVSIKQIHLVSHSQFVLLDPGVLATKENEKLTSQNAWWFVDNFICYSWLWGRLALHELCVGFQISPSTQHTFYQVNVLLPYFSLLVWLKVNITESGSGSRIRYCRMETTRTVGWENRPRLGVLKHILRCHLSGATQYQEESFQPKKWFSTVRLSVQWLIICVWRTVDSDMLVSSQQEVRLVKTTMGDYGHPPSSHPHSHTHAHTGTGKYGDGDHPPGQWPDNIPSFMQRWTDRGLRETRNSRIIYTPRPQ